MATENVKKFYEALEKNKELQEKFMAIQEGYEPKGKSNEEVFQDIVFPVAKEAGYEFTISEFRIVYRNTMAESGISEEELANVSGGNGGCAWIGVGTGVGGCTILGGAYDLDEGGKRGEGMYLCAFVGLGLGGW